MSRRVRRLNQPICPRGSEMDDPLHEFLRRRPHRRRYPRREDPTPMSTSELLRRTIRTNCQSRTHRPDTDLRPATSSTAPRRIRPPLQHATAPPRPATAPTATRAPHSTTDPHASSGDQSSAASSTNTGEPPEPRTSSAEYRNPTGTATPARPGQSGGAATRSCPRCAPSSSRPPRRTSGTGIAPRC